MKTPTEYTRNLKKGIITKQMLFESLYSLYMRIDNCRKQIQRKMNSTYDHDFVTKYRVSEKTFKQQAALLWKLLDSNGQNDDFWAYKAEQTFYKVEDLISAQFVTKVVRLICSDRYNYEA